MRFGRWLPVVVTLLLLLQAGIFPSAARIEAASHSGSTSDGPPVISILAPAEGQRVAGPTLQVQIDVRRGGDAALNPSSLAVTAVNTVTHASTEVTQHFSWDGSQATAALTETTDFPLGSYRLLVQVADADGKAARAERSFTFAIAANLARLVEQRVEVPWEELITFTDAREALEQAGQATPGFVDPLTGSAWWKEYLLAATVGRFDWLPSTSSFADRTAEVALVARRLVWKQISGSYGGQMHSERKNTAQEGFDPNAELDVKRETAIAREVSRRAFAGIGSATAEQGSSCPYYSGCVQVRDSSDVRRNRSDAVIEATYRSIDGYARFLLDGDAIGSTAPRFGVAEARMLIANPAIYDGPELSGRSFPVTVGAAVRDDWPSPGEQLPPIGSFVTGTIKHPIFLRVAAAPSFPIDPKWIAPDPQNAPTQLSPQPVFVQLSHDPLPPRECKDFSDCFNNLHDPAGFFASPKIIYREDFPPIDVPISDTYTCGTGPNPKQSTTESFDIDGDGIDDAEENLGWQNALTLGGQPRFQTDPRHCDSTGNGLKDGETRKWDQAADAIRPLFTMPGQQQSSGGALIKTTILHDPLTKKAPEVTAVTGSVPPQEWRWNAAAYPTANNEGRGFFQIDGTMHAPQSLWPDGRQATVKAGQVNVSLYSLDLNFQSSTTDNTTHDLGTFYLAVKPELAPDNPATLDQRASRGHLVGPLSIDTTGDFAVALDFLSADEANGFIVAENDQPGAKPQVRDIEGGIANFEQQQVVDLTPSRLKKVGLSLPLIGGFSLKGSVNDGKPEWEISTPFGGLKFAPENSTQLGASPRVNSPHELTTTADGPVLTQRLRLLGPQGTPAGPPLIHYQKSGFPFSGKTLETSSWNLPFTVKATNRAANPRDVLRVRLTGTVTWTGHFSQRLNSYANLRREVVGTNEFDQTFYIMLRRSDWDCAMCATKTGQAPGVEQTAATEAMPSPAISGGPLALAASDALPLSGGPLTMAASDALPLSGGPPALAASDALPLSGGPPALAASDALPLLAQAHSGADTTSGITADEAVASLTFATVAANAVDASGGSASANTIRVNWDARTTGADPLPAFVSVEAIPEGDGALSPLRALVGPFTADPLAAAQTLDLPVPEAGTYQVNVDLFHANLQLQDSHSASVTLPSSALLRPAVQLKQAVRADGGLTGTIDWTARNPDTVLAGVTAIALLEDAAGKLLEVVTGSRTNLGPGGTATGTLRFTPVTTPGYYQATLLLRDDSQRIVGQRTLPLALDVPDTRLNGTYGETPVGTAPHEGLTISVGVDAESAGRYQLYGDLYTADGGLIVHRQTGAANLAAGSGTIDLTFDGPTIGQAGGIGPYSLRNVELRDGEGRLMDAATDPFTTAGNYLAGSFPDPGVRLSGSFMDGGALPTGDGTFGALAVDVGLTVTRPGTYTVEATLTDAQGVHISRNSGTSELQAGSASTRLLFPGAAIAAAASDGPYTLTDLRVRDSDGNLQESRSMAHTTKTYPSDGFAGQAGRLTERFSHQVVQGSGGLSQLVLAAEVTVTRAGTYQLEALLSGGNGNWVPPATVSAYLEPGTQTVEIPIDLAAARAAAVDGKLTLERLRLLHPGSLTPLLDQRFAAYTMTGLDATTIILRIDQPTAMVNGQPVTLDAAPIIVDSRTLVPLRFVGESLNADVQWDGDTRQITVLLDGHRVELWLDQRRARIDGLEVELDVPPLIIAGRSLVPVRFVTEALDAQVQWEGATRTVTITR